LSFSSQRLAILQVPVTTIDISSMWPGTFCLCPEYASVCTHVCVRVRVIWVVHGTRMATTSDHVLWVHPLGGNPAIKWHAHNAGWNKPSGTKFTFKCVSSGVANGQVFVCKDATMADLCKAAHAGFTEQYTFTKPCVII
jgi:hypothetical protein